MAKQLEIRLILKMSYISAPTREEVIDAQDLVALLEKLFTKERADKTSSTCH
jgi:predicted nuclease with TOPRIM domain